MKIEHNRNQFCYLHEIKQVTVSNYRTRKTFGLGANNLVRNVNLKDGSVSTQSLHLKVIPVDAKVVVDD